MSLPDGVSANVVFIWEEIRGSHQRHYSLSEKRALYPTLPSNQLGPSQKSVCQGISFQKKINEENSNVCVYIFLLEI